jgi:pimeloyl-ACP methyl ester carboxylesterase
MAWPDSFCHALVARGFRVIRFDNRDVGLSGRTPGQEAAEPGAGDGRRGAGLPVRTPYTLEDMAGDTIGLMDRLGIERPHRRRLDGRHDRPGAGGEVTRSAC